MLRRRILVGLLAALLALAAAGCGKYADQSGPGGTTASGSGASGSTSSGSGASGSSSSGSGASTSGGGSGGQGASGGSAAPAPAEKAQLGPLAVGDTAEVGLLTVTVHQVETVDEAPAPGYTYVLIDVTVQNNGAAAYTVNPTEQHKLTTPEEKNAPYNLQATSYRTPRLNGTFRQGESGQGWLGFLAKRMDGTYRYTFIHPEYGEATWEFTIQ
jgi:hypothetical protein